MEYIREMLLVIWVVSLIINTNLVQNIIFGLIKVESPMLLENRASYQLQDYLPIFSLTTTQRFL